jgi:hypothetical protein
MTCVDQTFFSTFALTDFSISMYMMNFKKGSQITKDKLALENKKSLTLLTGLPVIDGEKNKIEEVQTE